MTRPLRLYCTDGTETAMIVATSATEAMGFVRRQYRFGVSARVVRDRDGEPVAPPFEPGVLDWEDPEVAPFLRDLEFGYGEFADTGWCETCGLHGWDGWEDAPAEWAVCRSCDRCRVCADDDEERCLECAWGGE